MSIHSVKMDVAINSTIQHLLEDDSGQYDDYLFGLGEKVADNQTEKDDENHLSDSSDDQSITTEVCPTCRKICKSANNYAKEHINRCACFVASRYTLALATQYAVLRFMITLEICPAPSSEVMSVITSSASSTV